MSKALATRLYARYCSRTNSSHGSRSNGAFPPRRMRSLSITWKTFWKSIPSHGLRNEKRGSKQCGMLRRVHRVMLDERTKCLDPDCVAEVRPCGEWPHQDAHERDEGQSESRVCMLLDSRTVSKKVER